VLVEERGKFLDEWGGFPLGFSSEEFSGAVGDINQLWQLYLEQWQKFGDPWTGAFQGAPEYLLRATSGDSGALKGLSDLYRNAYQDTLGRIVTSPNLGPTRELNEKLLYSFDAWFDWQMATLEYQSILSETWQQAMEHFMGQLVALAEKGESITSIRDLTTLWTRGAEEVFTNAFRTEKYVLAQGRMLNAAMQYRIQQRAILEVWLKAYDLPTRAELDEAHRRIYELRKEVKGLKRELAALKQSPVDAGAAGRRKTPQRRQRKSDQEELGG
jgi:class III poly(R)-hydroxyalkanoic acid synthase PhaE subunit